MSDARTERKPFQLSLFSRQTKNAAWVANHLKTSPQTVGRLIDEGKLQAYKIRDNGHWHIFMDSVIKFEQEIKDKHGIDREPETSEEGHL